MPIYEYYCLDCRKRVSIFYRSIQASRDVTAECPTCAGTRLRRLISRVTTLKSEDSRLESLADSSLMAGLESEDPKALASFMRRMSSEMGEPLDPEMSEVMDRLEAGENPESIEQSMPELGDGSMDDSPFGGDAGTPPIASSLDD